MTVIAYRDGLMAADSQVCNDEGMITGATVKLVRRSDGSIAGFAGHAGDISSFRDWFLAGGQPEQWQAVDKGGFAAIVVGPDGTVTMFDERGRGYAVEALFYAKGAGAELAFGAMAAGLRADQAVELACKYSVWCGGEVQTARIDQRPQLARALSAV
jgi:hypothetical protein